MWIFTTHGFLSVSENDRAMGPWDALLVWGQVREDLEGFADFAAGHGGRPIVLRPRNFGGSHSFTTSREVFAAYLAEYVSVLDYSSFRHHVAGLNPRRTRIYGRVWEALHDLSALDEASQKYDLSLAYCALIGSDFYRKLLVEKCGKEFVESEEQEEEFQQAQKLERLKVEYIRRLKSSQKLNGSRPQP
jgi:hypothetical protein